MHSHCPKKRWGWEAAHISRSLSLGYYLPGIQEICIPHKYLPLLLERILPNSAGLAFWQMYSISTENAGLSLKRCLVLIEVTHWSWVCSWTFTFCTIKAMKYFSLMPCHWNETIFNLLVFTSCSCCLTKIISQHHITQLGLFAIFCATGMHLKALKILGVLLSYNIILSCDLLHPIYWGHPQQLHFQNRSYCLIKCNPPKS